MDPCSTFALSYKIWQLDLAELPSKTGVGDPAPVGSAPCCPSYMNALQQVKDCEDTISDSNESVRVACNHVSDGAYDLRRAKDARSGAKKALGI